MGKIKFMATREQIAAVLLADLYAVGFSSANTAAQNLGFMNDTLINAIKASIPIDDLLDVVVPSEIVGMSAAIRDDYVALMFPVFERDSIIRSGDSTVDHRNPTKSIAAVESILAATNQGNSLAVTIVNYDALIHENSNVSSLTNLGRVRGSDLQEAMTYLDTTNPGW